MAGYGAYNQAFANIGGYFADTIKQNKEQTLLDEQNQAKLESQRQLDEQNKVLADKNNQVLNDLINGKGGAREYINLPKDYRGKYDSYVKGQKLFSKPDSNIVNQFLNAKTPQEKAKIYSGTTDKTRDVIDNHNKELKLLTPKATYLAPTTSPNVVKMVNGKQSIVGKNLLYNPKEDIKNGNYTDKYKNKSKGLFQSYFKELTAYKTFGSSFNGQYPNFNPLSQEDYANLGRTYKKDTDGNIILDKNDSPIIITNQNEIKNYDRQLKDYNYAVNLKNKAEVARQNFLQFTEQGLSPEDVKTLNEVDKYANEKVGNVRETPNSKRLKIELAAKQYFDNFDKMKLKDKYVLGDYFFAKYGFPLNQTRAFQKHIEETTKAANE